MALWTRELNNVITRDDAVQYSKNRDDTIKMKKLCYPLLNWDTSNGTDIDRYTLEKRMRFFELVRMQEAPSTLSPFWIEIIQCDDYGMNQLDSLVKNYGSDRNQNIYLYFVLMTISVFKVSDYLRNQSFDNFLKIKRFFLIKSFLLREYIVDINRYLPHVTNSVRTMVSIELQLTHDVFPEYRYTLAELYGFLINNIPF